MKHIGLWLAILTCATRVTPPPTGVCYNAADNQVYIWRGKHMTPLVPGATGPQGPPGPAGPQGSGPLPSGFDLIGPPGAVCPAGTSPDPVFGDDLVIAPFSAQPLAATVCRVK